jgi:hypothetical protein
MAACGGRRTHCNDVKGGNDFLTAQLGIVVLGPGKSPFRVKVPPKRKIKEY